jgi:S-adenosylmethionine hydrolase
VAERVAGEAEPNGGAVDPVLFFLSDYGTADEFVGVVHAVLHQRAPGVPVIDLSHQIPPFDVVAGSAMLVRAGPNLGAGVVLAVVDPGVGTDRRAVALEMASGRPSWTVGPDNGLLVPLATSSGGVRTAVALDPTRLGRAAPPGTFDGRDVFAPAAAHLATGGAAEEIGTPIDPATLVEPPLGATAGTAGHGAGPQGPEVVSSVVWIDRFGNAQLSVGPAALTGIGLTVGGRALVIVDGRSPATGEAPEGGVVRGRPPVSGRWVTAFGQLGEGELGVMEDANGQMSLVLDRASAAEALGLGRPGDTVRIGATGGGTRA